MWFERMGLYGFKNLEDIFLAGLAIGDPILLIGSHGSAKTTLCRKLAESLNLKFHAYDASKALFEDIIGFPNPDSISKGIIDYVPTALSIWDKEFILVDEISRARAESQNKWLEIIRNRKVMGLPIEKLKFIFAAMNPPSYQGSFPIDEALAGRFTFIINVPSVLEMEDYDIIKIINNVNEDDGRGLIKRREEKKLNNEEKSDFINFINNIRYKINDLYDSFNGSLDDYLVKFARLAYSKGIFLDGRRLNMIKRNIVAYIAVLVCKNQIVDLNFKNLKDAIFNVLVFSMPFYALNVDVPISKIKELHQTVFDFCKMKINFYFKLNDKFNITKLDNKFISKNYDWFKNELTKILTELKNQPDIEKIPDLINLLRILIRRIYNKEIALESNDIERICQIYNSFFDLSYNNNKILNSGLFYYGLALSLGLLQNGKKDSSIFKIVFIILNNDRFDVEKFKEFIKILKNNWIEKDEN